MYVNERPGWDSRGAHASVIMVTDRTTGRIFGAKEPYYKLSDNHDLARKRFEDLQKEHEHIQKLDHVRKHYRYLISKWFRLDYKMLNALLATYFEGLRFGFGRGYHASTMDDRRVYT